MKLVFLSKLCDISDRSVLYDIDLKASSVRSVIGGVCSCGDSDSIRGKSICNMVGLILELSVKYLWNTKIEIK